MGRSEGSSFDRTIKYVCSCHRIGSGYGKSLLTVLFCVIICVYGCKGALDCMSDVPFDVRIAFAYI